MKRSISPSNSLDKNLKKDVKILLNPSNNPKLSPRRKFPKIQISEIYTSLYKDIFPLILKISKSKFLEKINHDAEEMISKGGLKTSQNFLEIIDSKENILNKYITDYNFLAKEFNNFIHNKKNYYYFTHFRKHCGKTEKYGWHYCTTNQSGKFIEIRKNGEICNIICENCKTCYYTDFILMYCTICNRKYFSNILSKNENENLLQATWARYHCNSLINEIMKCIKCKNILYLDLKKDMLICTNKKCKFISKPEMISWTCNICGNEFSSPAKIYNPLEFNILKKSIKFALIKQVRAAPKKLPCGCSKDLTKLIFYHKEECKGELYKGSLMDKNIIVCSECHAINFEDKFTWICPICGVKFHLHTVIGTKPFVKKKYIINKNFNRSLKMNERKFFLMKNTNNLQLYNDNTEKFNNTISPSRIDETKNQTITNNNSKRIFFKDFKSSLSLSPKNNNGSNNSNRIYDYNKKNLIINLNKNNISNSKSNKKKKYRTLLDILNKRKLLDFGVEKNEENEFNKTMIPQKTSDNKILKNISIIKKTDTNKNENIIKLNKYMGIKTDRNEKKNEKIKEREKEEIVKIKVNKIISPIRPKKKEKEKIFDENKDKDLNKAILDTTDNSTFKTVSTNEQNRNRILCKSIHNLRNNDTNNNNDSIKSYKFWKRRIPENKDKEKNNDMFRLYKETGHKLNLIKYEKDTEPSYSNQINRLRDTTNINESNDLRQTIPYNIKDINSILYSDKTPNYNSPSMKSKNKSEKEYKNEYKNLSPFISSNILSHHKKNSSLDEDEQKDLIKDFIINTSNKKHFRESLDLKGIKRQNCILISPEKLNDLAKKTNIPSFQESDYSYIKAIGEGTYGNVYLVENNETMEHYALKKIICRDYYELIKQKEELELIFSVEHENILKLYGIQFKYLDETTSSIYVLMELANSDWNKEIKRRILAKKYYKENEIINLLKQIIKGFLFLQDKNIAHRDIKPQNILLFPSNIYKIADFGEAKFIKNIKEQSTLRGSELFMSPLLYKGYKYNQKNVCHNPFKSDVFSLGYCLIYAMFLNLNILDSLRELNSMKAIISCLNKNFNKNIFSEKMMNLVYKMIEPNEDLRYDFEDLSNELKNF